MRRLDDVEKEFLKDSVPGFEIGDTVEVDVVIREVIEKPGGKKEEKERIQTFTGTVIARRGSGVRETFTVRRIVQGEGVERTFPIHSPKIADIRAVRKGRVRRAKLYYLRDRTGKATRVREKIVERKKTKKGPARTPSRKQAEAAKAAAEAAESGGE
jgi:large subunit ribosomal protein L19